MQTITGKEETQEGAPLMIIQHAGWAPGGKQIVQF